MAKRKRRQSKSKEKLKKTVQYELTGLIMIALSVISIAKLGAVGTSIVMFFRFFMGEWYILGLLGMAVYGGYLMWKRERPYLFHTKLMGLYLVIASMLLLSHVTLFQLLSNGGKFEDPSVIGNTWELFWMEAGGETSTTDLGGGMVGSVLFAMSYFLFDEAGTKLIAALLIIIGLVLLTGKTFGEAAGKLFISIWGFIKKQWEAFLEDMKESKRKFRERSDERRQRQEELRQSAEEREPEPSVNISQPPLPAEEEPSPEPIISSFAERAYQQQPEPVPEAAKRKSKPGGEEAAEEESAPAITFTEVENVDYELPPLSLLTLPRQADQSGEYEQIHANAAKLERTFQSFGVKARVTQVHLGPAVTKYEVHPDVGVKVSKIVSLSDDLALALAAKGIRIEAPIPGKSAVGIEVPNTEVAMVSLREVLESKQNDRPDSKLMIGLGRDITGEAVLAELNKMPHLLVAGATGSGKSVCINGIITSILMRAKPHEVKLMMIDPKMVELNVYNGAPHLLAPVVTDPKKASQALKKVVSEMERRYELFSHTGTRNIEGYNEHVKRHNAEEEAQQPLLPYIVVIVDELADLMMVASSDVEDAITRLAQMARAAGIHLIIATQRPSVDVITGVIKANIPSRIAFAVSSMTDSRTILDMGGAEKLLGRGDMLFLPVGASKPVRVQGAFLSDEEVEEVVDFVISQQKAQYQEEMIPDDVPETASEVDDDLYEEAVELIVEMQTASVSMLQRRFRIGYTRAARLIDEMELRGIVGPYEGSKPRAVLVAKASEEASS
ncbi:MULTISPECIES: DNA translocase FtsK [Bacillaceae]|uniref:Cell division protein FtsK n=2 Tax=Bacillus infantis TaxID=324767 RepID=U5L7W5_9BACI|nr:MULTISPECIES: DNA translocase FtsK [Bacillus]OXT18596.1 DNA translocase FtsK [Bacillus sp. OG2]AGX03929.1 cell division protein FtsK [Bacillus infantis NRRL B-14911]MDW2876881.1 DNA translocase FtsK [Bacillus infantis]PLR74152.1 DNA translocase FtsK [Bacillus sp. UMB0728]TYS63216.1 DNA translocase FtsK [Bacillus infantis]